MSVDEIPRELRTSDVFTALQTFLKTQEMIMSALTDLQAAVTAAVTEIATLRTQLAGASAPVVVQGTSDADLAAQTAALQAAVAPPAAAPAAAPAA